MNPRTGFIVITYFAHLSPIIDVHTPTRWNFSHRGLTADSQHLHLPEHRIHPTVRPGPTRPCRPRRATPRQESPSTAPVKPSHKFETTKPCPSYTVSNPMRRRDDRTH